MSLEVEFREDAQRASVSPATACAALSGACPVAEATRQRVFEFVEALAGALNGADSIPDARKDRLGPLSGSSIPAMTGVDLWELADQIAHSVDERKVLSSV
ncbi:LacI family DNA-binding transcriptional regulator [Leifsonia poae]|uniref:LacI family DNA-binding transcriptional regulator n=1 Tax=Leifsonia poae TaxID=110933 RepID=UPI001CC02FCF|nr:LacI family DNA-binding transcriptional regulator [Leifsonia poae]